MMPILFGCTISTNISRLKELPAASNSNELPAPQNPDSLPPAETPITPTPPAVGVGPGPVATLSGQSLLKVDTGYNFTVTLSAAHTDPITINYQTQDGTAVAPLNYIPKVGSLTIPAGDTTAQISIQTTDTFDLLGTFKDFILKLTSTSAGTLDQPEKTISVGMHPLSGATDFVDSISSSYQRCLIFTGNVVKCWSGYDVRTPKLADGIGTNFAKIKANSDTKCILTITGGVKCMGSNYYGQLGSGDTVDSGNTLVDALGLGSNVIDISVGNMHACALLNDATIKCWGANFSGQLGDNSTNNNSTPTLVAGLTGVTKVSAGGNNTCVILTGGAVKCWGQNDSGQVGDGTTVNKLVPTDVIGLTSGVVDINNQSIEHTCALMSTATLKCWGSNNSGQLGDGTTSQRTSPVNVLTLNNVTSIDLGSRHSCAIRTDDSVWCWGGNFGNQMGDGTMTNQTSPVAVTGLPAAATKLSAGQETTCALLVTGYVYCWGNSNWEALGNGIHGSTLRFPKKVTTLGTTVVDAAKGRSHACIVNSSGAAKCWGSNLYYTIGDGTNKNRYEPVTVSGLSSGVSKVSVGAEHSCALLITGAVKCWGGNVSRQIGDGTGSNRSTPVDVTGLSSGVTALTAGKYHTCALLNTGGVKCWGGNGYGQLGNGTNTTPSTPVDVTGLSSGVTAISAGKYFTCALLSGAGGVKCWGDNDYGQLGNGTTVSANTPVSVSNISTGVTKISAGEGTTCAVVNGGAKCWGMNWQGQLGDNTGNDSSVPVDVLGLQSGVTDIMSSGEDYSGYTCALLGSGPVKCWGDSGYKQIASSNFQSTHSVPTEIVSMTSGIASLVQGFSANNCVLTIANELYCWGFNDYNQARGVYNFAPQPVLIGDEDL